jgi:hypothetical protein
MKFYVYLFILIEIGIKSQSSSVSFVNLISSIIDNRRFVQENFVDSDLIVNTGAPLINIDRTFSANGSNCSRDIQLLFHDLATRQIWALKSNF